MSQQIHTNGAGSTFNGNGHVFLNKGEKQMAEMKTKPSARSAEPKEQPEPTPESAQVPDWVNVTPDEPEYSLTMFDQGLEPEQEINLTRGEFIRLKRWVAALRSYGLRTPMDHKPKEQQEFSTITITQEEIEMAIDLESVADTLALNFRRRLREGAKVEAGKWHFDETAADTIENYEQDSISGFGRCGLDVCEVKTSAAGS
jgi:hypothetical protein